MPHMQVNYICLVVIIGYRKVLCTVLLCYSKAFTQSVNLTKHIRVHTGERPYVCSECGKCFTQSSSLDKHMRTHTGERPYACTVCPKKFAERGTLVHHMRTHTGTATSNTLV